jgi:hypothetical protein
VTLLVLTNNVNWMTSTMIGAVVLIIEPCSSLLLLDYSLNSWLNLSLCYAYVWIG